MKFTPQATSREFSRLIGIPYSEKNCWELVKLFYIEVLGIELKHYFDGPAPDPETRENLIYTNKGDFVESAMPKFGDIILFRVKGLESHIGIYINEDQMLHTTEKTGSVVDRMAKWSRLATGYYTTQNGGL